MAVLQTTVLRPVNISSEDLNFYRDHGYLRINKIVDPSAIDTLREEILEVVCRSHGVSRMELSQASTSADKLRQSRQYLEAMKLNELINGAEMISLASQLVEGPARLYSPFTAVKSGGGGGTFHFHQDNNYTQHEPVGGSLNIWVALSDMSEANGCLQVVPRSHLNGNVTSKESADGDGHREVEVDPATCVALNMKAGDAVAFSRWAIHGSGPNNTIEPRVAYALQYVRDDVKYFDKKTSQWKPIVEPLWHIGPVEQLGDYANES
jgi:ectoine hydroxylase-related dioxygenase (phytanoyl-CoA dioxygenase family)